MLRRKKKPEAEKVVQPTKCRGMLARESADAASNVARIKFTHDAGYFMGSSSLDVTAGTSGILVMCCSSYSCASFNLTYQEAEQLAHWLLTMTQEVK